MRFIKNLLIGLLVFVVASVFVFTFWVRDRYIVPILTYHHVGTVSDKAQNLNAVSVESFDNQMRFLKRWGYHVISFDDLVNGITKGYQFSRNSVVIQFDDGYEDNYRNAFPLLKKYGFPAMVFLVSDSIGQPGYMDWGQIIEMEAHGFLAGAHTRHHQYLPTLSPAKARDQIEGSKRVIEEHLGHRIDYFAYPAGGFNDKDKQIVREVGFKAAVTTNRGWDRDNQDLFALKRIRVKSSDNGFILWFKVSGYYNLFRSGKDGGCIPGQHDGCDGGIMVE